MTKELIELANALVGTDDDLEIAARELDVFAPFSDYMQQWGDKASIKQLRKDLKRVGVCQCPDSGEWEKKR